MLGRGGPEGLAAQLGARSTLHAGSCRCMTRVPRAPCLLRPLFPRLSISAVPGPDARFCQMRCQERLSPCGTKAAPRTRRGWGPGKSSNHLALQLLMGQPGPKPGLPSSVCSGGVGAAGRGGAGDRLRCLAEEGKGRSAGPGEREGRKEGYRAGSEERRGEEGRTLRVSRLDSPSTHWCWAQV